MTAAEFWFLGVFIYEAGNKPKPMLFCAFFGFANLIYHWVNT